MKNQTVKDAYSLPHIAEILNSLQGSNRSLFHDLKFGYWQMDEESKSLTMFMVGLLGFYECDRMPFRLTNTPTTFQWLMETCLRDFNLNWCIIYLDDIVIFLKDPARHLVRLEAMFQTLKQAGLKLKPSKCKLFHKQITFLGHIISAQGIATDEEKINAIKKWPTPTTVTKVQRFLGFTGYYCQFIPKFMHKLMSG